MWWRRVRRDFRNWVFGVQSVLVRWGVDVVVVFWLGRRVDDGVCCGVCRVCWWIVN